LKKKAQKTKERSGRLQGGNGQGCKNPNPLNLSRGREWGGTPWKEKETTTLFSGKNDLDRV